MTQAMALGQALSLLIVGLANVFKSIKHVGLNPQTPHYRQEFWILEQQIAMESASMPQVDNLVNTSH
jgi:hypothetical protein